MRKSDSESEYEDESIAKPAKRSRQSRAKAGGEPTAAPSAGASSTRENMRERLEAFYGSSDKELLEAIQLRARWGNMMFSLLPDQLEPCVMEESLSIHADVLSRSREDADTPGNGDFAEQFRGFDCVVDSVNLKPGASRSDGVSTILNAGYCVTSMDWSNNNLLAVGLARTEERPIDLSSLHNFTEGPTLVHIYDTTSMTAPPKIGASVKAMAPCLIGTIRSNQNKGPPVCVRWRSNSRDLAVVLGNGDVCLLAFSGKKMHEVVDFRSITGTTLGKATKLQWRTSICLVVGFNEGWLAEFDLSDSDYSSPSFVIKAHSSLISALATGWPNHQEAIFSSCIDGLSAVHDTRDLRRVQRPPRVRFFSGVATYIPLIQSFVTLEDADTTKLVILRQPAQAQTVSSLTRHDGLITAISSSPQHPLVASGAQDGTLNVANSLRRTMITRRQKDVMQDLKLWQLECSHKTSEYRFVVHNEICTIKHKRLPSSLQVYPPSVSITGINWQGTWIASSTASGLIRFDNVSA